MVWFWCPFESLASFLLINILIIRSMHLQVRRSLDVCVFLTSIAHLIQLADTRFCSWLQSFLMFYMMSCGRFSGTAIWYSVVLDLVPFCSYNNKAFQLCGFLIYFCQAHTHRFHTGLEIDLVPILMFVDIRKKFLIFWASWSCHLSREFWSSITLNWNWLNQ